MKKKQGDYKKYYGSREMNLALEAVESGKMTAHQASEHFKIPQRTMYLKVKQYKMQKHDRSNDHSAEILQKLVFFIRI